MNFLIILSALVLDKLFKEPKRFHPLVGFGCLANAIEQRLNRADDSAEQQKRQGFLALFLLLLPFVILAFILDISLKNHPILLFLLGSVVLYLAIGWQSLIEHVTAIEQPLLENNPALAAEKLSWIVSRDTQGMDTSSMIKASIESLLENGADALFASLFWFAVLGLPGVVLHRLSNTLDAMWGYKTPRFFYFGYAAARLDDVLNYIPARITALLYALLGDFNLALSCWQKQAKHWQSPNAGVVMAAGAGALDIQLGGAASYQGVVHLRPLLGSDKPAQLADINRAIQLLNHSLLLAVVLLALLAW